MSQRKSTINKEPVDLKKFWQFTKIFQFIGPYKWHFIVGLILLVISSMIFMIFPGAAGEMANTAAGEGRFENLEVRDYGWIFLVILVTQGIFSFLRTVLFAKVSEQGMADVRKKLYEKLITQKLSYYEQHRVGELTSRITTDVEQLQNAFSISLAEFIRQIVVLVIGVAILAWLTPKLSLIMLLSFPIIVILAILFGRYIRKISRTRQDALAKANTVVEETMQAFAEVKAFTNEWYESLRYGRSINEVVRISLRYAVIRGVFFIFIITVLFGGIFFILWQGALLVQRGEMPVGDLFSFIIYTGIIGGAIASLGNLYTTLAGAVGATERIQELLERDSEVDINREKEQQRNRLQGRIEFKEVRFRYPGRPDIEVLKGINMRIEPGQKIALVGQSGSGKSTIARLLLHFYDLESGQILIDHKPMTDWGLVPYRQNVAIVPQEVLLFGGTIEENIRYGRPDASHEEVVEAARQSNSLEFIESFPDGFQTIVGERGIKLSGGQRQRVAIARAILKDPSILILDEATSSLDAESEKMVQEALNQLMKGRTSVIIAHRLATIREVDCIYVLDNGTIIEKGTHEELSQRKDGAYSKLAKLQFEIA